jgi:acyl-CoA thioesterase FadM
MSGPERAVFAHGERRRLVSLAQQTTARSAAVGDACPVPHGPHPKGPPRPVDEVGRAIVRLPTAENVTPGERVLRDDGYRFVVPVDTPDSAFDGQGHLNNAAVAQIFNDLRVAYMITAQPELGRSLAERGYVIAVREMHVLFESQAMPGERLIGGVRVEGRRGWAQVTEQRIVEESIGRSVASAWLVHLILRDGRVVDWPDGYWETVADIEARAMPAQPRITPVPFGPPPPAVC